MSTVHATPCPRARKVACVLTRALLLVVTVGCASPRTVPTTHAPEPTPPSAPPAVAPIDPCLAADPADETRRVLDEALTLASERLERALCLTLARPTSDDDQRRTFDLEVHDRETERRVSVRATLERRGRTWHASPFLLERLIEDLGLEVLPEWLRRNAPRSIARQSLVADVTLVEVREAEHTTICLERAEHSLGCWREPGNVTRVVAWDWDFAIPDPETHPFGRLAIERPHGVVFWAVRTEGGLARAHARPFVLPEDPRRPGWSRQFAPAWPTSPSPQVGWRAVDTVEAPSLGPLRGLRIRSFGDVVDARTALARRVCARTDVWRCTAPDETRDSGHGLRESAIDDGGATPRGAWVLASSRSEGEVADTGGRGDARLVLLDAQGDRLVRRGEVVVGRVRWQTRGDRRREVRRAWHPVAPRGDDCFELAAAERFSGRTDFDFVPERTAPTEAAVASADRIAWSSASTVPELACGVGAEAESDPSDAIVDLRGTWRVENDGLRRVLSCDEDHIALAPLEIEPALPPEVRACFARLARQAFVHPPLARVSGLPCGAHEREGELEVQHLFVRDATGRVLERHARGGAGTTLRARRGATRGVATGSFKTHVRRTHHLDGQLRVHAGSPRLRYRARRSRTRRTTRWDGTACEGDPQPLRDALDAGTAWEAWTSPPTTSRRPTSRRNGARATCADRSGCGCEVDARDLDGAVRVR
ncbi:MAG: hypothetical protein H6720_30085 [Sandaracinus sp.]|nr:hypothetical protein [Sandaracinus sp.]